MRIKPSKIIGSFKKLKDINLVVEKLGVDRSTVYRWIKRGRTAYGYLKSSVDRKSTRPKTTHYALNHQQRIDIEALRNKRGYTAIKLKAVLKLPCSVSTVHRYLKRKQLVMPQVNYLRPRGQETTHMHVGNTKAVGYLQMDVKYVTPPLSGLPWTCFEYAVIDIYSRYKEAVILNQLDEDGSISALLQILPRLPFKPKFIQTDNGLEFQKRFRKFVTDLGLKHHHVHKNTPNENAVIERSFRTDEEEFYFRKNKRPKHYDELRDWFAEYLKFYNYERPHLGINLKRPIDLVANVVRD